MILGVRRGPKSMQVDNKGCQKRCWKTDVFTNSLNFFNIKTCIFRICYNITSRKIFWSWYRKLKSPCFIKLQLIIKINHLLKKSLFKFICFQICSKIPLIFHSIEMKIWFKMRTVRGINRKPLQKSWNE